jgi:hypothetical protein
MKLSRGVVLLGFAIAITAIAGAVAVATIPDASGVIHGCYNKSGDLRVIDDAVETCKQNETPLNWNQTGPQGPSGPLSGWEIVTEDLVIPPTFDQGVDVECPQGKKVVGGGWSTVAGAFPHVISNGPIPDGSGWHVFAENESGDVEDSELKVRAICAFVSP